jgi:hypothetical protein
VSAAVNQKALAIEEGENVRVTCNGIEQSLGTEPRQAHREHVSIDEQWELVGKVIEIDDPRDEIPEESDRTVEDVPWAVKRELIIRGWESRDDYDDLEYWNLEAYFDSDTVRMKELPHPSEADVSPGADSPRQTKVTEIIREDVSNGSGTEGDS